MTIAASTIFHRTTAGRHEIQNSKHELNKQDRQVLLLLDGQRSVLKLYAALPSLSREQVDNAIKNLIAHQLINEKIAINPSHRPEDGMPFNPDQMEYFTSDNVENIDTQILQSPGTAINIDDHAAHRATQARIEQADSTLPLTIPAQQVALCAVDNMMHQSELMIGSSAHQARTRMASTLPSEKQNTSTSSAIMWRIVVSALLVLCAILIIVLRK